MQFSHHLTFLFTLVLCLSGCAYPESVDHFETRTPVPSTMPERTHAEVAVEYDENTKIHDVQTEPALDPWGYLLFPLQSGYWSGTTLKNLDLAWYSEIDSSKTVEIANYMRSHAAAGDPLFFQFYTEEEMAEDPGKRSTGLFFFKGNPGERFAVCNAGGGFAYVAAMHDSFPQALELSKLGYNAFALIYRPSWETAYEDLSRAIAFISEHAAELEVFTDGYSVWGGSAGARMAIQLGSQGVQGQNTIPKPAAVITQYTGETSFGPDDPPTYANVGTNDGIANWRTMQQRLEEMSLLGIPTEFHVYDGLRHGFGLGTGTAADGWIREAADFWERQVDV